MAAQSPSSQPDGEVLEGFICPICYQDLRTFGQLQEHFELAHSVEDQDVLRTLKDFFGKAKRKILKQDSEFVDESNTPYYDELGRPCDNSFRISEYLSLNQELGSIRVHTPDFKRIRDERINRYVIETNKLLIRLDRIVTDAPEEPEKRKAHEKNVVPWIPDGDVNLCPGCAKSFRLQRRRHHCRLCGCVMCQACSKFIDMPFANKLIQPTFQDAQPMSQSAPPTPSQRRESSASLLSVMNLASEPQIRVCRDCLALLVRRDQQIEQYTHKSLLVQKYNRMKDHIGEIKKLSPLYHEMVESLFAGEDRYHLRDAQEVKMKLSKMAEGVDVLSKSIIALRLSEDGGTEGSVKLLKSNIRMSATQYLRNTVLGIPQIPTEEEISRFKRLREEQIQRKIQKDLEAAAELSRNSMEHSLVSPEAPKAKPVMKPDVVADSGWTPSAINTTVCENDDPMLQQMTIIQQFIKQARMDSKYDEVRMLENNLRDLKLEYCNKQRKDS